MGQSLSLASVERVRDSILLALHTRFAHDEASPLSAHALAVFRRLDPEARGWIASSSLDTVLRALGISQRWSRWEIDAFVRCFVLDEEPAVTMSYGATTSSRLDYELFLDFVFFPVSMASYATANNHKNNNDGNNQNRNKSKNKNKRKNVLQLTQYAVVWLVQSGCVVHSGYYGDDSVTVKEIQIQNNDPAMASQLRHRVNALRLVAHANLVRYRATVQSKQSLYIVEDAFPSCTLQTILASFGAMKEATIRRYMGQVLEALAELHARDVVHGHLCLESVHIDSYGLLKLSEFGIGTELQAMKTMQASQGTQNVPEGNHDWVNQFPPPEVASRGASPSKAADVWCVGVLILEMAYGIRTPAEAALLNSETTSNSNARDKKPLSKTGISSASRSLPPIPSSMSKNLRDIVRACLSPSARKRPAVQELLVREFFQIDHAQATNEMLRDVCSDLDASMKRLTTNAGGSVGGVSSNTRSSTSSTSIGKQTRAASASTAPPTSRHFSNGNQRY